MNQQFIDSENKRIAAEKRAAEEELKRAQLQRDIAEAERKRIAAEKLAEAKDIVERQKIKDEQERLRKVESEQARIARNEELKEYDTSGNGKFGYKIDGDKYFKGIYDDREHENYRIIKEEPCTKLEVFEELKNKRKGQGRCKTAGKTLFAFSSVAYPVLILVTAYCGASFDGDFAKLLITTSFVLLLGYLLLLGISYYIFNCYPKLLLLFPESSNNEYYIKFREVCEELYIRQGLILLRPMKLIYLSNCGSGKTNSKSRYDKLRRGIINSNVGIYKQDEFYFLPTAVIMIGDEEITEFNYSKIIMSCATGVYDSKTKEKHDIFNLIIGNGKHVDIQLKEDVLYDRNSKLAISWNNFVENEKSKNN